MLEVEDLNAWYGKSHILQGVSLNVGDGEIVSLLGRNGAGRSTTIKAIMGEVPPTGAIRFKGARIELIGIRKIVCLLDNETVVFDGTCGDLCFLGLE